MEGEHWIHLTQESYHSRGVVNTVMNLPIPKKGGELNNSTITNFSRSNLVYEISVTKNLWATLFIFILCFFHSSINSFILSMSLLFIYLFFPFLPWPFISYLSFISFYFYFLLSPFPSLCMFLSDDDCERNGPIIRMLLLCNFPLDHKVYEFIEMCARSCYVCFYGNSYSEVISQVCLPTVVQRIAYIYRARTNTICFSINVWISCVKS
jgi:hypothetical protein